MKYYSYYADGSYAGTCESQRMPNNSTIDVPPELPWDHVWPRYDSDHGWLLTEDHRARSVQEYGPDLAQEATDYWLPGDDWQAQPRHMTQIGPLPEGALLERPAKPEPTAEEAAEARAREIMAELEELDAKAARPMRAMLAGTSTDEDKASLEEIESNAQALREELASLGIETASL